MSYIKSQKECIINHLNKHGSITQLEALRLYGCMRLGARIFEIKELGFNIKTNVLKVKKKNGKTARVAKYLLKK